MAFQQPTRQAVQRPPREESEERTDTRVSIIPVASEESQTWVLFSPTADTATTSSVLDSLPESSQQTAGRSRLSDLGSLRSLAPSNYASSYAQAAFARPANLQLSILASQRSRANEEAVMSVDDRPEAEDDAELDSLDSHLPDFRPTQNQTQGQQIPPHMAATATTTVNLPTHDGLGSFRLGDTAGMSAAVQEHLYLFEQFNPRRITKRRRDSLDLTQLQTDNEFTEDIERTRRIEAWRWEHSRVLLEEIQKETRRRRGSELSARRSRSGAAAGAANSTALAPGATAGDATQVEASADWHDQEEDERLLKLRMTAGEDGTEENEGLWSRITRKFMLEVMGIDDRILSVLFGEGLVGGEDQGAEMDLSSTPKASNPLLAAAAAGIDTAEGGVHEEDSSSWQLRMLERIAKELGLFVHSHVNSHPGAFSTFVRVQQMPLPYAGLPVIPETVAPATHDVALGSEFEAGEVLSGEKVAMDVTPTGTTASLPRFKPTIYQARPMDILGQAADSTAAAAAGPAGSTAANLASSATAPAQAFTQDEWEQDLDIKLVFRYLRSRFFSGSGSSSNHAHRHHLHHHAHHHGHGSGSSSTNVQEAAAKVARVRQHHPLVGRGTAARQPGERRPMPAFRNMNAAVASPASPILGLRHGNTHAHGTATSCASQSTRRSARRSSISSRHSSRHYWDIGGSIGTGSMIASAGPMGSWGEV